MTTTKPKPKRRCRAADADRIISYLRQRFGDPPPHDCKETDRFHSNLGLLLSFMREVKFVALQWIPISPESLPPDGQMVALINVNRRMAGPGDYPICDVGYVYRFGIEGSPYWSCCGSARGVRLEGFTHYQELAAWPWATEKEEGEVEG